MSYRGEERESEVGRQVGGLGGGGDMRRADLFVKSRFIRW